MHTQSDASHFWRQDCIHLKVCSGGWPYNKYSDGNGEILFALDRNEICYSVFQFNHLMQKKDQITELAYNFIMFIIMCHFNY